MRMMSGNVSECVGAIDKAFGHRFGHGCYIGARGGAHAGDWYGALRARVTSPQVAQVDGMLVLREYYNSTTQLFHARDDPAEIHACEGGYHCLRVTIWTTLVCTTPELCEHTDY